MISLVSLVSIAIIIGIFAARSYTGTAFRIQQGVQHLTMDHVFNGTFSAQSRSVLWVPEGMHYSGSSRDPVLYVSAAGDGVFATVQGHVISLVDLKTNSTQELVSLADLKDVRTVLHVASLP